MIVGYFINIYPRPSHSFIRREIAALEAGGMTVRRFSLRPDPSAVDEADRTERSLTRYILVGKLRALFAAFWTLLWHPLRFLRALRLALRIGKRSDRGRLRHLAYLVEACVLRRWLKREKVRHLHAHFGTNSAAIAMLCRVLGGPTYSFTVHGPEEFDKPEFLALREKVERSSFTVAVCDFGRSQLFRWVPYDQWHKVEVVRCGLDAQYLQARYVPVPDVPRLVSVGRLSEQKGQLLLIDAAARLVGEGLRFELLLIGDGELRRPIERMIERHGLWDVVKLKGWQTNAEVRDAILESRALVLPSFAEGLPVVLMEALALRRPVISTYVAGIPELVIDGENGVLIPAGSTEALAEAMREVLLADAPLLSRMGRDGHDWACLRHNAATEAAKLAALFHRAAGIPQPAELPPTTPPAAPASEPADAASGAATPAPDSGLPAPATENGAAQAVQTGAH